MSAKQSLTQHMKQAIHAIQHYLQHTVSPFLQTLLALRERSGIRAPLVRPILLIIAIVAVLIVVYARRTDIAVDVGTYEDSIYLNDFHDREVDAAGPGETWQWEEDEQSLTISGHPPTRLMVTVYAADEQPDGALDGLALSANDTRLTIARTGERFMVGVIPPEIASKEEVVLRLEPGLREGPTPPAGLAGEAVVEAARTYRWSQGTASISFPAIGRGAWMVHMDMVSSHPGDRPVEASLFANGVKLADVPDTPELRRVHLLVPPSVTGGGDLTLGIQANVYRDPRPLGVLVADVSVDPAQSPTWGQSLWQMFPPTRTFFATLIIVFGIFACLTMLFDRFDTLGYRRNGNIREAIYIPIAIFAVVLGVLGLEAWALFFHRYPVSFMLVSLATTVLWSLILLHLLLPLLPSLFNEPTPKKDPAASPIPTRFIGLLLLIFFVSYWVKMTGILYPYFVGIDVHWHMDRVRWILEGGLPLLYGTSSPLNESTMPLAEWGPNRPVIPYSPFYHMFAASFSLLPWSLEMSANLVSVFLDSMKVLLIGFLARGGGLSKRMALFAALLYAILPVTYLLHSWGNVPTTFGLWWAFLVTIFLVVAWNSLQRWGMFLVLTFLFLCAFLYYTVAGVFTTMFLILFTLAVLWISRAQQLPFVREMRSMWLAALAAAGIATLVYYGQYIGPIVSQTLPYFADSLTSSAESMGKQGTPVWEYITRHLRLWDYGLLIPLLVSLYWIGEQAWHMRRPLLPQLTNDPFPILWAAVVGWMGVTLLFIPLAYKVSMVDKHFFVTIPLMVIATAAVVDRLWEKSVRWRWAVGLWYGYLALSAVVWWVERVLTVKQ